MDDFAEDSMLGRSKFLGFSGGRNACEGVRDHRWSERDRENGVLIPMEGNRQVLLEHRMLLKGLIRWELNDAH